MAAIRLFPPDTNGAVVVREDPTVLLCTPGDVYALTVAEDQPPVPAVLWEGLPGGSGGRTMDAAEDIPGVGFRNNVRVAGHSIGKRYNLGPHVLLALGGKYKVFLAMSDGRSIRWKGGALHTIGA